MTWLTPLIPKTTVNPFTGQRPSNVDVQVRVGTLREMTSDYTLSVNKEGSYYVLTSRATTGHKPGRVVLNLGKTIPEAHRALCVIVDTFHALNPQTPKA